MAQIVEKEGIGFSIASLEALSQKLAKIDSDTYAGMLSNVARIRDKIANGHFLQTAINTALEQLE